MTPSLSDHEPDQQCYSAYTLSATLFEVLSHPSDLARVKSELAPAIPNKDTVPSYAAIETLPYFNACIKEALRLHPGVMSRMPRISPETDIVYHDKRRGGGKTFVIPRGTTASMSTYITHTDPDLFEEPYAFKPQRWIDNPLLSRAFIAFSRGSRNCVGLVLFFPLLHSYSNLRNQERLTSCGQTKFRP